MRYGNYPEQMTGVRVPHKMAVKKKRWNLKSGTLNNKIKNKTSHKAAIKQS